MATNNNSNRYPSEKGRFFKGKTFILLVGLLLGAGIMVAVYKTSVYFSSDDVPCPSACGRQLEALQTRK